MVSKLNTFSRKPYLLAIILLISTAHCAIAQNDTIHIRTFFTQRDFGKYFISDMYAPNTSIDVGIGLNLNEYNISTDRTSRYVFYNESTFGAEIPIFRSQKRLSGNRVSKFAISIPLSANIWFDFFEKATAPILDTDYRFALGEFNYLREVNKKWLRNYSIKFLPIFHESTHLGDELTLYRVADSLRIIRVNVTYEAARLAFTINDPNGSLQDNHSFRISTRFLLNPSKGWYTIRPIEGDTSLIKNSKRWIEASIQYQMQRSSGILANENKIFTLSAELQNRVQFGYPFQLGLFPDKEKNNKEQYRLCLNTHIGWRFKSNIDNTARFGAYLRYYIGINPHGQFRNIPYYEFLGVSFGYEN